MPAQRDHEPTRTLFIGIVRCQERCRRRDLLQFLPGPLSLSGPGFLDEIQRAAGQLSRFPLPPGARILVQISHPLALTIILPALWSLGWVPILTEGSPSVSDQSGLLQQFSPDALLQDSGEATGDAQRLLLPPLPLLSFCLLEPHRRLALPARTVLVRTTSGTSGMPRGLALSGAQVLADAANIVRSLSLSPDGRSLAAVSMSHAFGFSTLLTPCLFLGIPLVLLEHPLPELFRKALGRNQALFFPGIPLLFDLLLASRIPSRLLSRMNPCISAGAPLSPETAQLFRQRTGNALRNFYGASECGAIACDRSSSAIPLRGCVGAPLHGVRVLLETTRVSSGPVRRPGRGRTGRLIVRGKAVALGYVGAGRRPRLFHGRFSTGDMARIDRAGRIFLQGRLDSMINVGGRKVFPEEVELVLRQVPGVRDVAIVGIPDPLRGEMVAGAVAGAPSLRETVLLSYCRQRLSAHRIPRRILILQALPRTPRGKVDTARIRQLLSPRPDGTRD